MSDNFNGTGGVHYVVYMFGRKKESTCLSLFRPLSATHSSRAASTVVAHTPHFSFTQPLSPLLTLTTLLSSLLLPPSSPGFPSVALTPPPLSFISHTSSSFPPVAPCLPPYPPSHTPFFLICSFCLHLSLPGFLTLLSTPPSIASVTQLISLSPLLLFTLLHCSLFLSLFSV